MAITGRLDGVTIDKPTGRITVQITTGEAPLPLAWGGQSLIFNGSEEMKAFLDTLETEFTGDRMAGVQLASAVKADPTLGAVFVTKCTGKTCVIDLTGAVSVISVGV